MKKYPISTADGSGESMDTEIEVRSYSGRKADERPREIIIAGRNYEVTAVADSFLEELSAERTQRHHFKVICSGESVLDVYHDLKNDKWFLRGRVK